MFLIICDDIKGTCKSVFFDVLLVDDIQFIIGKDATQEEFFNTFNELHCNNKQIIISSDRSPDDLNKLEERLRTRFNWGLTIDILPPDFKLRMDIIDKKIESNEICNKLPDDVKEYMGKEIDFENADVKVN